MQNILIFIEILRNSW